ncbi:type I restriction endonuclease subunit S [Adhaeribacter arboris]|uniref:Type I restriction endonuclease subunit S n=1 Tax=Adhaeribacter arboris TaxID=2072846 RepID=A0A2T2YKC2_9BACT|nr:restriction endonuclease subunit S [Adhaeribacter arboris]PSR55915.1 type I restriction endonuclease subunit S [Adhaeribacter arboris]
MALGRKPIEIVEEGKHQLLVKAEHWDRKYLKEVAKVQNGYAFSSSFFSKDEGMPLIRIRDIDNTTTVDRYKGNYSEEFIVHKGNILIGMDGDFKASYWKGPDALLNQRVCRILPDSEAINERFLFYCLQPFLDAIHAETSSVTVKHLSSRTIEEIPLPYPTLDEQQEIVAKIEELLSELDKGKEQLETARQQLKVYRQAVLKWAFEGKLTNPDVKESELLEGWRLVKIGDICKSIVPNRDKPKSFTGEIKWVTTPNLSEHSIKIDYTTIKLGLSDSEIKEYNARVIPTGSVIMTCVGTFGISAVVEKPIVINQQLHAFLTNDLVDSNFLAYCIQLNKYYFEKKSTSTTIQYLNKENCNSMPFPLCTIEEQRKIVQEVESRLSVCDKVEETITQSLQQAETLCQSILKKAFEGKLVAYKEVLNTVTEEQEAKIIPLVPEEEFPMKIAGITATDLHAGILALVIDTHEKHPEHLPKLNHVKDEKIAHQVENFLGISLGRQPVKDAAGPDDFNHLKKVEHRATKAGWFQIKKLPIGHTYTSLRGMKNIIAKTQQFLTEQQFKEVNALIETFLKFDMEQAEVIATLFAGWNNLLLASKNPTDDEIVYESRENWSERKLNINREKFYKALTWMRSHNFIPQGKGSMVLKTASQEKKTLKKKK